MSLLNAWALGFAAIAPLIILLYLLKLKRRSVSVSTLMFWQRVLEENRRHAFLGRLRSFWSLLLHLLIFTLILLALARPVLDRAVDEGTSTVLILDTRARMRAMEPGGETRMQLALLAAGKELQQANASRQFAVIQTAPEASVTAPFSGDARALRERIGAARATDAGSDLADALRLADTLLASRSDAKRLVLVTAPSAEVSGVRESHPEAVIHAVGTPRENVAITGFSARSLPTDPETAEVFIEIQNFGAQATRGNVELSLDGRLLDVRPVALAPGESKAEVFPLLPRASSGRGWLVARWDQPDALTADNSGFAVLPTAPLHRVLLVTPGNWFLEKLLIADSRLQFELLRPEAFQVSMAAQFDAVVLDRVMPADFNLAATQGNFLFVRDTPFSVANLPLEQPLATDLDSEHPTLRSVNLDQVAFARASAMSLPPPANGWRWAAPIRYADRPLMVAGMRGNPGVREQRVAAFAFDVADSDLPLRIAFPLLMGNTIHWLAGDTMSIKATVRAGETITLRPGEEISLKPAVSLDESALTASEKMARDSFIPTQSGFYRLSQSGAEAWIAVNTFAAAESDLRSPTAELGYRAAHATPPQPLLSRVPLWHFLALAALALLSAEWWLFHRRRTE